MSTNKEDRSFKTLINRETTDSVNKFFYNELGADTLNVHAKDIWTDTIPDNDPSQAVSLGVAEQRTLFAMTEDPTVPNQQCWKAVDPPGDINNTRLLDWISPKFGADFTIKLFDGSDNEIFTTDPVAWFFDYQTGILTFSGSVSSKPKPFKVTGYRYIGIKGTASIEGVVTQTASSITVSVDYNDPSAVDPPAGEVFITQADIDNFLLSQGTSNFKHLSEIWKALPRIISHNITIELASGVHRPKSGIGSNAFPLTGKDVALDVNINVNGSDSSTWDTVVSSATVTAVGPDVRDPYVDFSGTPFPNDGSLRGLFVVFNTGQVAVIHKHTDSRLYTLEAISPTPSSGVVSRPSTILRNSLDDATAESSGSALQLITTGGDFHWIRNLRIDPFGCFTAIDIDESSSAFFAVFYNCLVDHAVQRDIFGLAGDGKCLQSQGVGTAFMFHSSYKGSRLAASPIGGSDDPISTFGNGVFGSGSRFYAGGADDPVSASDESTITLSFTVLDENQGGAAAYNGSKLGFQSLFFIDGKDNEIRDCTNYGLKFEDGASIFSGQDTQFIFTNQSGPCVSLKRSIIEPPSGSPTFVDGGGNDDVGIELIGNSAIVSLPSGVNVTGTNGDVRLRGGEIVSYADIETDGPFIDEGLNIIEKAP